MGYIGDFIGGFCLQFDLRFVGVVAVGTSAVVFHRNKIINLIIALCEIRLIEGSL